MPQVTGLTYLLTTMVNYSVKAFVKRIITNRKRYSSWSIDRVHNRLYTIIPFTAMSQEFVNYLATPTVHKFKFNRKLTISVTVGINNVIIVVH